MNWLEDTDGTYVCSRCNDRYGAEVDRADHDCVLPCVLQRHLYLHQVPEDWPYPSRGQHAATVRGLIAWMRKLPLEFLSEIKAGLQ